MPAVGKYDITCSDSLLQYSLVASSIDPPTWAVTLSVLCYGHICCCNVQYIGMQKKDAIRPMISTASSSVQHHAKNRCDGG